MAEVVRAAGEIKQGDVTEAPGRQGSGRPPWEVTHHAILGVPGRSREEKHPWTARLLQMETPCGDQPGVLSLNLLVFN